jgi:hypothetical protein
MGLADESGAKTHVFIFHASLLLPGYTMARNGGQILCRGRRQASSVTLALGPPLPKRATDTQLVAAIFVH